MKTRQPVCSHRLWPTLARNDLCPPMRSVQGRNWTREGPDSVRCPAVKREFDQIESSAMQLAAEWAAQYQFRKRRRSVSREDAAAAYTQRSVVLHGRRDLCQRSIATSARGRICKLPLLRQDRLRPAGSARSLLSGRILAVIRMDLRPDRQPSTMFKRLFIHS